MNRLPSITDRIRGLKRFFVFYRKPEYLRAVKKWLDIRPEDIPAVEISDDDKLCKNPLVSVLIPTYNQERFIRQAIDSALNQETDFEYEILIGDDCSTDGTGDICSTYQKTYPDKVRFITADRNVYQLGGNGNRLRCRARGEFLALLEGDDYWTDKHKLQKQVDVFRRHPDVTLCLSGRETLRLDGTVVYAHNAHFDNLLAKSPEQDGTLFDGDDYFSHPLGGPVGVSMYRKSDINYDVFCTFYFRTSYTLYFLLLKKGRGYLLRKPMTMYRVNPNGVWNGKTPFEKAKEHYEYYCMLALHAPDNRAIQEQLDVGWRSFRRFLFPWAILGRVRNHVRRLKPRTTPRTPK